MRSTLIGFVLIIALCGGGLFALRSYFGREAQMRDAERTFLTGHTGDSTSQNAVAAGDPPSWGHAPTELAPAQGTEAQALESWYADAGTENGPGDPTPEDKSYLINDAQPLVDAEPS